MTEWKSCWLWPWQAVTLTDGTAQRGGNVMRRKINGEWQYRLLTENEEERRIDAEAW